MPERRGFPRLPLPRQCLRLDDSYVTVLIEDCIVDIGDNGVVDIAVLNHPARTAMSDALALRFPQWVVTQTWLDARDMRYAVLRSDDVGVGHISEQVASRYWRSA